MIHAATSHPPANPAPENQTDTVLILTAKKGRATKLHKRVLGGGWETQGYDRLYIFRALEHRANGLRAFFEVLKKASRNPSSLVVGETLVGGQDPNNVLRRIHGDGAGLTPNPVGHHWICWEVDGVTSPPDFFDSSNVYDRSKDADLARWWIREHLPPQFHGRSAILQWSSSALLKGKISFHLWMWMDRPVARASIRAYAMTHWRDRMDCSIWDGARVHYIADPIFKQIDGTKMDDPLAGRRWQWVQGDVADHAEALSEWVDQPTWDALKAAEKARKDAEDAANAAKRAAVFAAAAASYRERRKRRGASAHEEPEAFQYADEEQARAQLARYKERIARLTTKDSKHEAIRSIALWAAVNLGATLTEQEIRDELEDVASEALQKHGDRSRPALEADKESASIFASAFTKARVKGFRQPKVPAFAAIGATECLPKTLPLASLNPSLPVGPNEETPPSGDAESNSPPSPIALDSTTASLNPSQCTPHNDNDLDAEAELFAARFIAARAELAHLITETVTAGGRHAVKAPAGLGKSHAICESLISYRRQHRLTARSPVHVAVPDLGLAREMRDDLRRRGANAVLAVTRTERNCDEIFRGYRCWTPHA